MTIDLLLTGTIDNYIPNMKGGNLLNYAKVVGLLKNPETKEIEGVEFEDTLTGKTYKVKSKVNPKKFFFFAFLKFFKIFSLFVVVLVLLETKLEKWITLKADKEFYL